MEHKRHPARADEPEVTFELEETPQSQRRSNAGAAGAAAVAGAGLVSSAASSDVGDSLDVFDQIEDAGEQSGDVPVTSFEALGETEADPEFPVIDFTSTAEEEAGGDAMFGATSDVGGGFVLEETASEAAFGAVDDGIEPVPDSLIDDDLLDELPEDYDDDPDDLDIS